MKFVKTSKWLKLLFPNYIWSISNTSKKVYLTFDDGPIPHVTEWVLDILKQENIKATFFCIGENIKKNPDIFKRILSEGHSIGNHTYNHLNGWNTQTGTYYKNAMLWETTTSEVSHSLPKRKLFRPPYGKIKNKQAKMLQKMGYEIIMWEVLSYDFDTKTTKEKCLENVLKNTTQGSVIVFHDSLKAKSNLEFALPKTIAALKLKGFQFDRIR
ncbi:polysaccharide deacetylase family protein [Flavobacterium chuncheonense]|uniref:Polysaccharide deacetylase family protein n=1 Tax=Flavobacterium chuncheonense TaxID=2026653 RepID=A0ABW5YQ64_9FLAO